MATLPEGRQPNIPVSSERPIIPERQALEQETAPTTEKVERGIADEVRNEKATTELPESQPPPIQPPAPPPPVAKSEMLLEIEHILEEELGDFYFRLEPKRQQRFKLEGERTARKIEQMLRKTRLKTGKIIKLVIAWLRIIPGVSRFFIEQEAKIKASKIISLKR